MSALRDYQAAAVSALRDGYRQGHRCQMLMLATGGGKTRIAAELLRTATSRGRRGYFIVDRIELVHQAVASFLAGGMRVGVIQGQHPMWDPVAPVQVASIQTLVNRTPPEMDFAIIDEAHVLHRAHLKLMQDYSAVPFIGLSATPFAAGLGKHFTNLVIGATTADLTAQGWLVPSITYAPAQLPSLEGVKVGKAAHGRDYNERQLAERMSVPLIMADVVSTWLSRAAGRPTLCFAVTIGHSQALAAQFVAAGVRAVHIDAYTDSGERRAIIGAFKRGQVQVLCSVGVLTTGFDAPNASCLILARPTKSLMLHIQQLGRGLRIDPDNGKRDCLVLDHAGNTLVHGFAHDPLPQVLDDGAKRYGVGRESIERPEALPKECPECHFIKPAGVRQCPECGYTPRRPNEVETVDGSLHLVDGTKPRPGPADRQRWYSMLLGVAAMRGYSDGWAGHTYRDKFGVWPRGLARMVQDPDAEVLGFVRHKAIAWARRREQEQGQREREVAHG